MGTLDGILVLHFGESLVEQEVDLQFRREVIDGQTVSAPTATVLDSGGSVSTHLTVFSIAASTGVLGANTAFTFKVTVEATAVVGDDYEIKFSIPLSGGATIVECLGVTVEPC